MVMGMSGIKLTVFRFALLGFIVAFMILASSILVPLTVAALLAMVVYPVGRWLEARRVPRGVASVLCLLLVLAVISGLITLLSSQVIAFARDVPTFQTQLNAKLTNIQHMIQERFGVAPAEQIEWARQQGTKFLSSSGAIVTGVISGAGGAFATFSLIMLYIFFLLQLRDRIYNFVLQLMPVEKHSQTKKVMLDIQGVTQSYLVGVLIVIAVLATMNSVGLLIVDVQPAIFLGLLAALLNIIPYIGVLIGSLLPIIIALITKESFGPALAVGGIFWFNQFVENNFLTPNIVGSKISLNPLATILALIVGNLIWGTAGMILFIPLLGVLKILFENIEATRPYAYLVGDDVKERKPKNNKI